MRITAFILTLILLGAGCSFDPGAAPRPGGDSGTGPGSDASDSDRDTGQLCPTDLDGDGFGVGPDCPSEVRDCNDTTDQRFPGAPETCNGADDDCDGTVDEGCECVDGQTQSCGSDVGACSAGIQTCIEGSFGPCTGATGPTAETCNELDDNCDGTADEGCECATGETRPCGESAGACTPGMQSCTDGTWDQCEGGVGPSQETCNGVDDNCDGTIDNGVPDLGAACTTNLPGVCDAGVEACVGGNVICQPLEPAGPEVCNGLDDDCDGNTDEDVTRACTTACGPGTEVCSAGVFQNCVVDNPPAETCDGDDNDCDGEIDEDVAEVGQTCNTGSLGPCGEGSFACEQGSLKCVAATGPSSETCDGVDNDCDGDVDEDDAGILLTEDCGACPLGTRICQSGAWTACSQTIFEVCNGSDSNCDGAVDNTSACLVACGNSTAVGTLSCGAVPSCTTPQEICGDGIDNDCDGTVDQNCAPDIDEMVYIPGGRFILGSDPTVDPDAQADEQPQTTISLSPYYIDETEVSRTDYATCVTFGGCSLLRSGCPLQLTNRDAPIGCVTWDQADDYCSWAGKRLPTEAEWERAARGGWNREVIWPWGNTANVANGVFDCTSGLVQCTANVDSFPQGASSDGLLHMAGNVAEWVSDFYDPTAYSTISTSDPEQTTDLGLGRVIRGGSYAQGIEFGRVSNRARPDFFSSAAEIGIRCATDAP